jgi:hypothetical protein
MRRFRRRWDLSWVSAAGASRWLPGGIFANQNFNNTGPAPTQLALFAADELHHPDADVGTLVDHAQPVRAL